MNTTLSANTDNALSPARVRPRALTFLCISVFLLTGMPRLSIKFGDAPLYIIDVFVVLAFYFALQLRVPDHGRRPFSTFVFIIGFFAVLGEIGAVLYSGDVFRPLYALARTFIALSLVFSTSRIIQTHDDLLAVVKAAVLGIGLTSLLMIFSSLPVSRALVAATVFSIPFLEPASSAAASYAQFADLSTRGRSLVGVSILSGAFINAFWPLIALNLRLPWVRGRWRKLVLASSLLAPFGIVMSYSRGAILGLILVITTLLLIGSGRSRSGVLVASLGALIIFHSVGWDSDVFYFERVVERTSAIFDDPYKDEREWERIYAYSQPFEHAMEHPTFLLVGEGTAIAKTGAAAHQEGQATHAVFAMAYYSYGMAAAITYVLLIAAVFLYLLREVTRKRPPGMVTTLYYQALLAGFAGMSTWFVFGHAAVSTPRGAMLMFLLLGLVRALRNVEWWEINSYYRHLYR